LAGTSGASKGTVTTIFAVNSAAETESARTAQHTTNMLSSMVDAPIRFEERHDRRFGSHVDPRTMLHMEPPSYQPQGMAAVARQVKRALVELKGLEESQVIQGQIGLDVDEDDAVSKEAREKLLHVLGQQPGEARGPLTTALMATVCLEQDGALLDRVAPLQSRQVAKDAARHLTEEYAAQAGELATALARKGGGRLPGSPVPPGVAAALRSYLRGVHGY